jgi:hypothetical protein
MNIDYIVDDINRALENKAYLSALALALTLPDICGKIAYPEVSGKNAVKIRYEKWIDEYVYTWPSSFEDGILLAKGKHIYALRCQFLHNGMTPSFEDEKLDFSLRILKNDICGIHAFGSKYCEDDPSDVQYDIHLDLRELCNEIVRAAKKYCEDNELYIHPNIEIFYDEKNPHFSKNITKTF